MPRCLVSGSKGEEDPLIELLKDHMDRSWSIQSGTDIDNADVILRIGDEPIGEDQYSGVGTPIVYWSPGNLVGRIMQAYDRGQNQDMKTNNSYLWIILCLAIIVFCARVASY